MGCAMLRHGEGHAMKAGAWYECTDRTSILVIMSRNIRRKEGPRSCMFYLFGKRRTDPTIRTLVVGGVPGG